MKQFYCFSTLWNIYIILYFIPRCGSQWNAPQRGPIWISYYLYWGGEPLFAFQIPYGESAFFFAQNSLSPVAGATEMLPYGVPFDLSFFFISSPNSFFWLQIPYGESAFFSPAIFYIDGWDGRSTFFFISWKLLDNYS